MQASPDYGSPIGVAGSSPIYTGMAVQSPGYNVNSPIYQPANSVGSGSTSMARPGQSPQYSPGSIVSPRAPNQGNSKPYSPVYNPVGVASNIAGKSPAYSPASNLARMAAPSPLHHSPAYSPGHISKSHLNSNINFSWLAKRLYRWRLSLRKDDGNQPSS